MAEKTKKNVTLKSVMEYLELLSAHINEIQSMQSEILDKMDKGYGSISKDLLDVKAKSSKKDSQADAASIIVRISKF
jgi:hypothetical protein